MLVGDSRLLNVRVIKNNEIIYEGMVENAPSEIKHKTNANCRQM